ncbi:MAG TPA: hypothetical protein VK796_10415 [Cytophaga sp.]|nr:hypothetical protein [Cytophaga sp.]
MKEYLNNTLMNYLLLRSTIYPPPPNIYTTKDYYIIGWNMTDYREYTCCKMDVLEKKITSILKMKKMQSGKIEDFYLK